MIPDLFWIPGPWRGKLAILARPRGGDWLDDEAIGWRNAGLKVIVSLLEPAEVTELDLEGEATAASQQGLEFISFPIPDRGVPDSMPDAISWIKTIQQALEQDKNVAIHCRQGLGRSTLATAGTLALSGIDPDEAVRRIAEARGRKVPETAAQLDWIHRVAAVHH